MGVNWPWIHNASNAPPNAIPKYPPTRRDCEAIDRFMVFLLKWRRAVKCCADADQNNDRVMPNDSVALLRSVIHAAHSFRGR